MSMSFEEGYIDHLLQKMKINVWNKEDGGVRVESIDYKGIHTEGNSLNQAVELLETKLRIFLRNNPLHCFLRNSLQGGIK